MTYNIVLTTAEDVFAVVDAVVAKGANADVDFIAEFTGIATIDQVEKALTMAMEFNLINLDANDSTYSTDSFLARSLVTAISDNQKAAMMRLILENYKPYRTFRTRYNFTKSIDLACKQTKAIYSLNSHERDIKNTLISVATYAKALKSEGANLYSFVDEDVFTSPLEEALSSATIMKASLQSFFGENVYEKLDSVTVFQPLSYAFQKVENTIVDTNSVVVCAANAFESFLLSIADDNNIPLTGRNGILQKRDALSSVLSKKHRGMIDYIGQVRNAADHGADVDEGGKVWNISVETAKTYPLIVAITIRGIMLRETSSLEV